MTEEKIINKIESFEVLAEKEIIEVLELSNDDININLGKYRGELWIQGHNIFCIMKGSEKVEYSSSIYAECMNEHTRDEDRIRYKKLISVYIKLLDIETAEKIKMILEKYRQEIIKLDEK